MKKSILLFSFLCPSLAFGQQYSINWHKIAGGGGNSTNGQYSVSGVIGQPDASGALSGGLYSLTGGYWSFIALVQTAGAPMLSITHAGSSAIISWPSPSTGFLLQTSGSLSTTKWTTFTGTIATNTAGTISSVTITPPNGNVFFRLAQ
jgi:hypothetical protein